MSLIECIDNGDCFECDHDPAECQLAGRCYYEWLYNFLHGDNK